MQQIKIIGDSILKGVMYIENESGIGGGKYKLYTSTLENRMAERGVKLSRVCHMGATIDAGYERIKRMTDKGESLCGATVLLEFGGNDCSFDWKSVSEAPNAEHHAKTELPRFCDIYRKTIELVRSAGGEVMMSTLVPIDAEKYMNFISNGLSYKNILTWLGDVSMLYRWHESYNRAIEKLADELSVPLFDLRSGFLNTHSFKRLICADGIHPTLEGHKIIEDQTVSLLSDMIVVA